MRTVFDALYSALTQVNDADGFVRVPGGPAVNFTKITSIRHELAGEHALLRGAQQVATAPSISNLGSSLDTLMRTVGEGVDQPAHGQQVGPPRRRPLRDLVLGPQADAWGRRRRLCPRCGARLPRRRLVLYSVSLAHTLAPLWLTPLTHSMASTGGCWTSRACPAARLHPTRSSCRAWPSRSSVSTRGPWRPASSSSSLTQGHMMRYTWSNSMPGSCSYSPSYAQATLFL